MENDRNMPEITGKMEVFHGFPFSKNDERDSEKMILALEDVGSYGR